MKMYPNNLILFGPHMAIHVGLWGAGLLYVGLWPTHY